MREEIESWLDQSDYDYETAKYLCTGERYGAAAFSIQQAVEKALKAYYLFKLNKSFKPTHSLVYLASESNFPGEHYRFLKELTPEYVVSRYPDSGAGAPHKYYDKALLDAYFKDSEKIIKWIRSQIMK